MSPFVGAVCIVSTVQFQLVSSEACSYHTVAKQSRHLYVAYMFNICTLVHTDKL